MDWIAGLKRLDAESARAFVQGARNVIDALMVEARRPTPAAAPPGDRDYASAGLSRTAPPCGWLSSTEVDRVHQQMVEAMAAEKWVEGAVFAVRLLKTFGG